MVDEVYVKTVDQLTTDQFDQCYKLVRGNLKGMYEGSGVGWDSQHKKQEMQEDGMEFMIYSSEDSSSTKKIDAFASFIHDTEEYGIKTTYLYEIQVSKEYRNKKIGTLLINQLKKKSVGVIMLTVFCMNDRAIDFYKRHGFEYIDKEPGFGERKGVCEMVWFENGYRQDIE